jgi:hypothetical protein
MIGVTRDFTHTACLTGSLQEITSALRWLVITGYLGYKTDIVQVQICITGNSVKIGDGPAAVNGDERCTLSLPF